MVAGDQWGLIVDQLDVTKKEKNRWALYDATFLVQVELGDGARLWFPKEEVIEVVAGGIAAHDADGERQRHDEFACRRRSIAGCCAREEGNVLGQTPVAAEGTLGHYGKNAKNPLRTARRESLSQDQLREMLRPGDWIWIYNGNGSAGGGHSVVFAGWGDETAPQAQPLFEDPPKCPESLTEEHDGARAEIKVAHAFAYSQLNNNPKTDKEAGGRLHSLRLGPYFYRQFDAEKEKDPDSEGTSAYRITPVYCVTRPDPSSHPAGTAEEILQYNRDKAVKDNLAFLKRNGLGQSLDPAALLKIVGDKAAKAATGKRGKEASADDVAALQRAERSSASELMALGYAVARWQVLDAKAASGWMLDVVHLVTKAELTAARLDGDE